MTAVFWRTVLNSCQSMASHHTCNQKIEWWKEQYLSHKNGETDHNCYIDVGDGYWTRNVLMVMLRVD